jgi:hypothetical protein
MDAFHAASADEPLRWVNEAASRQAQRSDPLVQALPECP